MIILSAISTRFSVVSGIPSSSRVKPTTDAPYFATIGKISVKDFSSPFTEFTIALPLYALSPASRTSGFVESS